MLRLIFFIILSIAIIVKGAMIIVERVENYYSRKIILRRLRELDCEEAQ
jgi:hypothetical protein